ncbi:hypothetical protein ACFXDH_07795 [Streptomyces sp. NPDC059467]|uniref:hypothetical protein n=1 Tax=Streptomyces sp. NPDC059467 TaxID=3346844 RepID=UPI0036B9E7C3
MVERGHERRTGGLQQKAPSRCQDLTDKTTARVHAPGVRIDVHAGTVDGVTCTADTHHPVQGLVATLYPEASYDLRAPAEHRLFAHLSEGRLLMGGRELRAGQTGWSAPSPAPPTPPCSWPPSTGRSPRASWSTVAHPCVNRSLPAVRS